MKTPYKDVPHGYVVMSAFGTYLPAQGVEWTRHVEDAHVFDAATALDLIRNDHKECAAIRVDANEYKPQDLTNSPEFSSSLTPECVGQGRAA